MSAIFWVAAKLLGIYLTYLGLMHVLAAWLLGSGETGPVLVQLLSGTVALVLAFLLAFQTDWLARLVRVGAHAPVPPVDVDSRSVLRTGIVLVGLYVLATRLPSTLNVVSMFASGARIEGIGGAPVRILIEMVPLALALLFTFGADRVVGLVMTEEKAEI